MESYWKFTTFYNFSSLIYISIFICSKCYKQMPIQDVVIFAMCT